MTRRRCCCIPLIVALALSSCLSPTDRSSFFAPWPQQSGSYQLPKEDVWQIVNLASKRKDILRPIEQIVVRSPNEVQVTGGSPRENGDPMTFFIARKTEGRWKIVEKSIYTGPCMVTS
jgi:hypothetical protein